jgi:thiaminase
VARIEIVRPFSQTLPESCAELWTRAIDHPFVRATADGTLAPSSFHTWIQQDRRFVQGLERFGRELIAVAPADDVGSLESGLAALGPELEAFREYADENEVRLDVSAMPVCDDYLTFLRECIDRGYQHALVAYYGCERAYLDAWSSVRDRTGLNGRYAEWIENWTSEPFRAYVEWLADCIDRRTLSLTGPDQDELREVFCRTVAFEASFWDACREPASHRP